MKKVFLALLALSIPHLSRGATATDPRGLTRRIAPLLPARTAPPSAPQVRTAPPAQVDPAKAAAAKDDVDKKRLEYQRKRAEAGSEFAQYDLGIRYLTGDGVEKNTNTAKMWLEKAAKNDNSAAKKKLQELKEASK
jgi:TPR repeat protein